MKKIESFSFEQSNKSDGHNKLFNIDVLCINCSEMINCDEIDEHSRSCNKVSKKVELMENSNALDQINFKIEKLLNSIEKLDYEMNNRNFKFYAKTKKQDRDALDQLKDLIKRIYIVNAINLDNIKILKDYALKIHHIIKNFAGSPAILIYLERVKTLTKDKYQEMAQIDIKYIKAKNNDISNGAAFRKNTKTPLATINEKESIISIKPLKPTSKQEDSPKNNGGSKTDEKIKRVYFSNTLSDERPKWGIFNDLSSKYQTEQSYCNSRPSRLEMDKCSQTSKSCVTKENDEMFGERSDLRSPQLSKGVYHIEEISSDVNKQQGLNSSQSSVMQTEASKKKSVASNLEEMNDPFAFQTNNNKKKVDSDELQRNFYTKCLNAKMKFSSDSKVQRVSIALIYKEAMDKKIPQNEWNSFIDSALKLPDKYLDLSKLKIRNNKKILQNRLVEFSQDKQYKEKIQK